MDRYEVECADRASGKPYVTIVEAKSEREAVAAAGREHVVAGIRPAPPAPAAGPALIADPVVAELRQLRTQVAHLQHAAHRRDEFSIGRVLLLLVIVLVIIAALGGVMSGGWPRPSGTTIYPASHP